MRRGQLHHVHRGVYRVGYERTSVRGEMIAAVLACDGTVLGSRSALELWRVLPPAGPPYHLSSPTQHRNRPGIVVHRSSPIPNVDLAAIDRIPLTSPARSLLDFAEIADPGELEQALDEARIGRLVDTRSLEELRGRTPGRRRKAADLQAHGLTVLQVTGRQLVSKPEWVIARIATVLAARPAPGRPSRSSPSAAGRAW